MTRTTLGNLCTTRHVAVRVGAECAGFLRESLARGSSGLPGPKRLKVAVPPRAASVRAASEIVRGRVDRVRAVHAHQDDLTDGAHQGPAILIECDRFVVERAAIDHRRDSLEAIALAEERVDHVHLHAGVVPEIGEGAGRPDVGEHQVVVVPHRGGALGRKVRRAVGTYSGDEAQALFLDDPLHVGGQNAPGAPPPALTALDCNSPSRTLPAFSRTRTDWRRPIPPAGSSATTITKLAGGSSEATERM